MQWITIPSMLFGIEHPILTGPTKVKDRRIIYLVPGLERIYLPSSTYNIKSLHLSHPLDFP